MTRPPTARLGRRAALRAAALVAPLLAALAVPTVASAAALNDLPGHAGSFTVVDGLLWFLVGPVGAFLLIALIVMRPGSAPKSQRYRPGRDWRAEPSWSGLRPDSRTVVPAIETGEEPMPVMEGAPHAEHPDSAGKHGPDGTLVGDVEPVAPRGKAPETGGARGSW